MFTNPAGGNEFNKPIGAKIAVLSEVEGVVSL
jgi:hypothetical protein